MAAAARLRLLRKDLSGRTTFGRLARKLGREGAGLLVILLAIPFLHPLPMGGLSLPAGLLIAAVGLEAALGGGSLRLPRFAAERRLEESTVRRILSAAERLVSFLERFSRPRWKLLARSPKLLGTAIAALGLMLAFPFYFPFATMSCSAPLILLGLALTEEDGLCAALGLLGGLGALAYHAAIVRLVWIAALALVRRVAADPSWRLW